MNTTILYLLVTQKMGGIFASHTFEN